MKKKVLAILFSVVMAVCLCGFATMAFAPDFTPDDSKTEIHVTGIDLSSTWAPVYIKTDSANSSGGNVVTSDNAYASGHVQYTYADGNVTKTAWAHYACDGNVYAFLRTKDNDAANQAIADIKRGDIVTITAGFGLTATEELKTTVQFIFDGAKFIEGTELAEELTFTGIDLYEGKPNVQFSAGNPYAQEGGDFTSNYSAWLKYVDKDGNDVLGTTIYHEKGFYLTRKSGDLTTGDIVTITKDFTMGGDVTLNVEYSFQYNGTEFVAYKFPITLAYCNYTNIAGGYGNGFEVGLTDNVGTFWQAYDATKVALVDKNGKSVLTTVETCGQALAVNRNSDQNGGRAIAVGDVLTLKAGFEWCGKEFKEDVSFIYLGEQACTRFAPTALTTETTDVSVMEGANLNLTVATTPVYSAASVVWTVANTEFATVVGNGLTATVTGVKQGTTTVTADCFGNQVTFNVTVTEAVEVSSISVDGKLEVLVGGTLDFSQITATKHYSNETSSVFTVTTEMLKGTYDLNTVGTYNLTIETDGKSAPVTLEVKEIPVHEMTVNQVNYDSSNWGAPTVIIMFNLRDANAYGTYAPGDLKNVEYINAYGEKKTLADCTYVGSGNFIFRMAESINPNVNEFTAKVGDKLTVKAGFRLSANGYFEEIKTAKTYIFDTESHWVEYVAETHDATSVTITNKAEDNLFFVKTSLQLNVEFNEGALATAKWTSSNDAIATVDENGLVTGVAVGKATITATVGELSATYEVEIAPEVPVSEIAFFNSYVVYVLKDGTFVLPADFTARPVYEYEERVLYGAAFAVTTENLSFEAADVDTSEVTDLNATKTLNAKLEYEETEYDVVIQYAVYEPVDMSITEVAIVDWFGFNSFVEYPNTTLNRTNLTIEAVTKYLANQTNKITYTRANGDVVSIGLMQLGMGNIAVCPAFTSNIPDKDHGGLDEFNKPENNYYMAGDMITLEQGLTAYRWTGENAVGDNPVLGTGMVIPECVLKETVKYKFDGQVWGLYIPYENITVANENLEIVIGKPTSAGAQRVPATATEGKFLYAVEDETVATVTDKGVITGKKVGTTTVTVTLTEGVAGDKVATVNVTVVDQIVSVNVKVAEGKVVKVKKGATEIDFKDVTAEYVWASGKTEAADMSTATVVGLDTSVLGETSVTLKFTKDGQNYNAMLNITVVKKDGCGATVLGLTGALTLVGAAAFVFKKRK